MGGAGSQLPTSWVDRHEQLPLALVSSCLSFRLCRQRPGCLCFSLWRLSLSFFHRAQLPLTLDYSCTYGLPVIVYGNIVVAHMAQTKLLSVSEIAKHNSDTDCWIVVDRQVWDITGFAPDHPGGPGSQLLESPVSSPSNLPVPLATNKTMQ